MNYLADKAQSTIENVERERMFLTENLRQKE